MKDIIYFSLLLTVMATAMFIPTAAIMYFFRVMLGLSPLVSTLLTMPFAAVIVYSVIQITDKLID